MKNSGPIHFRNFQRNVIAGEKFEKLSGPLLQVY